MTKVSKLSFDEVIALGPGFFKQNSSKFYCDLVLRKSPCVVINAILKFSVMALISRLKGFYANNREYATPN
jgi:hypothetical protein